MATWADVRRIVAELPDTEEVTRSGGLLAWQVRGKRLVWERPLRKADHAALGAAAPDGPILGAQVPDEGAKHALIADDPGVYFTTPHFDGYPIVLAQLDRITDADLRELVTEAWLATAPQRLTKPWLAERQPPE